MTSIIPYIKRENKILFENMKGTGFSQRGYMEMCMANSKNMELFNDVFLNYRENLIDLVNKIIPDDVKKNLSEFKDGSLYYDASRFIYHNPNLRPFVFYIKMLHVYGKGKIKFSFIGEKKVYVFDEFVGNTSNFNYIDEDGNAHVGNLFKIDLNAHY